MNEIASLTDTRGRDARAPREIPKAGWRDILLRVKNEIGANHVTMVAASIAFYGLLALFPAIAATIGIGGLVLDPQQVGQELRSVTALLPHDAATIILDQSTKVAAATGGGVALAAAAGLLFALYSASRGMKALIEGLNIVYREEEERGFIELNLIGFALTLGAVIILLMWFWVSAFIVLVGAALNAEIEHQTARDSTLGPPQPMGDRGAHVADTLGEVP